MGGLRARVGISAVLTYAGLGSWDIGGAVVVFLNSSITAYQDDLRVCVLLVDMQIQQWHIW
jgi:hypothetical protein